MMPRSLRLLLEGVIDYAGLFPPAKLDLDTSLSNYVRYKALDQAWLVSRFVIPAGQLDDVGSRIGSGGPYLFSAILSADKFDESVGRVIEFNKAHAGRLLVDSVEYKPNPKDTKSCIEAVAHQLPGVEQFVEIGLGDGFGESVKQLAESGRAMAKLRTGGVVAEAFPSVADLATGIAVCARHRVPFKATAGLHHPIRHFNDSVSTKMHGFLNVLVCASIAAGGFADSSLLRSVLDCEDANRLRFEEEKLSFDERVISTSEIAQGRKFMLSFGSCSIEEPVEDLQRLGYG